MSRWKRIELTNVKNLKSGMTVLKHTDDKTPPEDRNSDKTVVYRVENISGSRVELIYVETEGLEMFVGNGLGHVKGGGPLNKDFDQLANEEYWYYDLKFKETKKD